MSVLPLDPVLSATTRLSIVAVLAAAEEVDFATVRDAVELSDSALSKQASALEAAGYVAVRKGYVGKRPRTWLRLTPEGRAALRKYVATLNSIVAEADRAPDRDG
ncbi:winged helix-turn-helix domain-containing protein [Krasilnikovia sp. MM14-A1004]|uniref:winged helix-turn-helix domain-containing protein n=1 Tax=Krasilnikovia sp. MM14-A1004 TaxID=3373541 RepID=UPI00399C9E76